MKTKKSEEIFHATRRQPSEEIGEMSFSCSDVFVVGGVGELVVLLCDEDAPWVASTVSLSAPSKHGRGPRQAGGPHKTLSFGGRKADGPRGRCRLSLVALLRCGRR